MHNNDSSIFKLKTSLVSILMPVAGLALLVLAKVAENVAGLRGLTYLPLFELGSTLFITGTLVNVWAYVDGRDRERRDDARLRRLLKEAAPDFSDAVVQGFAVSPADLERVATPDLLDGIATNTLALRLGDRQLAGELYAQLRDQAIRAPERWHDVQVRVRLASREEPSATGAPLFDVLVEWEYTTIPSQPLQRFACVSDRAEFNDLVSDVPATLAWLIPDGYGLDARGKQDYELLAFAVDGRSGASDAANGPAARPTSPRSARRSCGRASQYESVCCTALPRPKPATGSTSRSGSQPASFPRS